MTDELNFSAVELAIGKVTCLEDRAQIERRGIVRHGGGLQRYEISGVSIVAVERSLKLEVSGATLVDAKLVKRWREKPKGVDANASTLKQREESLDTQWREVADDLARLNVRREVTASAWKDLTRSISQGAGAGKDNTAEWLEQLSTLSAELDRLEEERRVTTLRDQRLQTEIEQLRAAQRQTGESNASLECSLRITLDGAAADATVRASYLVPCAVWRPAYRATLVGEQVSIAAEAVVWQRTGEAWNDVELWCSTARPTLGATPPVLVSDWLSVRPKQEQEKRVVDVAVREEVIQTTGEGGGGASAEFPGLDDGGETRLLRAGAKVSIPTDGQPHRAGLFQFSAPAQIERICAAELTPLVSVVAKFSNSSPNVLLAGPVDLVRKGGFVGRAQLKFAGPGETIALSFGTEDAVRVFRQKTAQTDEARITGRKTTTTRLQFFVSNAGVEPMKVSLEERVPVSEVKEVEVNVLMKECKPAPSALTKDGITRLEVELAPHGLAELKFAWELQAASKVAGL